MGKKYLFSFGAVPIDLSEKIYILEDKAEKIEKNIELATITGKRLEKSLKQCKNFVKDVDYNGKITKIDDVDLTTKIDDPLDTGIDEIVKFGFNSEYQVLNLGDPIKIGCFFVGNGKQFKLLYNGNFVLYYMEVNDENKHDNEYGMKTAHSLLKECIDSGFKGEDDYDVLEVSPAPLNDLFLAELLTSKKKDANIRIKNMNKDSDIVYVSGRTNPEIFFEGIFKKTKDVLREFYSLSNNKIMISRKSIDFLNEKCKDILNIRTDLIKTLKSKLMHRAKLIAKITDEIQNFFILLISWLISARGHNLKVQEFKNRLNELQGYFLRDSTNYLNIEDIPIESYMHFVSMGLRELVGYRKMIDLWVMVLTIIFSTLVGAAFGYFLENIISRFLVYFF
ncbi:MAG: hypothetical protein JW984_04430 [Deltaproteobacteria bacterium]|uniref:Uncharacterized protein n=1 Tax=Candidatus Zymogenus saltonus TaxID=2844893 RepID=A0A9D8KBK9_9DELT|nr:hypothetical protein [Candidatus Zymogenus saltonus]